MVQVKIAKILGLQSHSIPIKNGKRAPTSLNSTIKQIISCLFCIKKRAKSHATPKKNPKISVPTKPLPSLVISAEKSISILFNHKTQKYTYIAPPPPIKNLVISGGGAKGTALPGVFRAFEEYLTEEGTTFKDQLENAAGSSVGALGASLFAAGMGADEMKKALNSENFKKFLGRGIINKSGQPLLDFMRKHLKQSVASNLKRIFNTNDLNTVTNEHIIQHLNSSTFLMEDSQKKIVAKDIAHLLSSFKNDPFLLTFRMLDHLQKFDPTTFKNLTITATCRESGSTFYFDAASSPDLEIALACRASASLPIVLAPVWISKTLLPGYKDILPERTRLSFVDGGYLDNIPVNSMKDKQGNDTQNKGAYQQNLQTLALVFDETRQRKGTQSPFLDATENKKKHKLYDSRNLLSRLFRDIIARLLAGIKTKKRNTKSKEEGLERIRKAYTQRVILLKVKGVKTGNFEKAQKLRGVMEKAGHDAAASYLETHKGELLARHFENPNEILDLIPEDLRPSDAVWTQYLNEVKASQSRSTEGQGK